MIRRTAADFSGRLWHLLILAAGLSGAALVASGSRAAALLMVAAASVSAVALLVASSARAGRRKAAALAAAFADRDRAPGLAADGDGRVIWCNDAARHRFDTSTDQTLVRALGALFADPTAVIHRLQSRAELDGAAQEDVVTRHGHVRISVHRFAAGAFFWRFDEMAERGGPQGVEALALPMMTLGRNDTILFMNAAARRLLGGRRKALAEILPDGPVRSGDVARLNGADGRRPVRVAEIPGPNNRRELYLLPVEPGPISPGGDTAFDNVPVALLRLTPDGNIQMANPPARALLGDPEDPMFLPDLVKGLGRSVLDWLDEVAQGRASNKAEVLRVRRDDREVFLQITLQHVSDDHGTGLLAVLTDATELKKLEAQFVQSQKMQAIGQLAGGVAHDFNNLLTAISGHCDLLMLRHDQGDPDFADLVQISQNANRAAGLVGHLLAFSRKQTLRPEMIDLRDTLTELTHLLDRLVGERVTLSVSQAADLSPIRADKRKLEQVIMNLVVNARDAMPDGGEIRIEAAMETLETELRRDRATVPPGAYARVRILDQGDGIPPDRLTKIFEPFFTTKGPGEGTGLGLSTAYGIVKQSGGFIFVDSKPGEGTCFTLYFPARAGARPQPGPKAQAQLPDLGGMTFDPPAPRARDAEPRAAQPPEESVDTAERGAGVVLLVEDEAPVRAFASRALRMRGFTVLEADSAEGALRTLRETKVRIDVFVTDVVMPGKDGPSWVRQALRDYPDAKVVFISGYAEDSFSDTQARIPNSVFLPKPFSLSELTATVHAQMS